MLVIVPYQFRIEPACERGLKELERRKIPIWRTAGFANLDIARSQLATDALAQGHDALLWIDADIGFTVEDVDRLVSHNLPLVAGVYAKKGVCELTCHVLPGAQSLVFGKEGGLEEVRYAPTGFLYTKAEVYQAMQNKLGLPECNKQFGKPLTPYFASMVVETDKGPWYLGDDFAFCERARRCGYPILIDTTIRLFHYGMYGYSWEEAGAPTKRFDTYRFHLG